MKFKVKLCLEMDGDMSILYPYALRNLGYHVYLFFTFTNRLFIM